MHPRFDSRPILVRRAGTATLHGAVVPEGRERLTHSLHLFCVIAASVVVRNVASQQVLDALGPSELGRLYMAVALLAGVLLAGLGWLSSGWDPRRITWRVHFGVAVVFALGALPVTHPGMAVAKYLAAEVGAAALLLAFGLLLGTRFAPREARKMAARVGAGGILGGLVGGVVLGTGATLLGTDWLYLIAAAAVLVPLAWIGRIEPPVRRRESDAPSRAHPKSLASYGRWVAVTTLLMVATTTLVDYQFRFGATRFYQAEELAAFFGLVVVLAGLITVLFQVTLLEPLLDRLGLFATAAIMPIGIIAGLALLGVFPSLAMLVVFKLVDSGANMSVQQATGGLLLAPLATRARSLWQSRIDGLAKRGGQALTGAFLAAFPWQPERVLPVTLVLAGVWIAALMMTRARYIKLLTEMLGAADGGDAEVRAYDGDTVRLLEAELAWAELPRARVVLELLAEAGYRADDRVLARLDAVGGSAGALLVVDYLAQLEDRVALGLYSEHRRVPVAARALLALAALDMAAALKHARKLLAQEVVPEELRALAAALLAGQDSHALELASRFARAAATPVRLAVASGLGRLPVGAAAEVSALVCRLAADEDPAVAQLGLEALARHPSPAGTEIALAALGRRHGRAAAARALAALGAAGVEVIARQLALARDPRVLATIAWVLGRLATASAVGALVGLLEHPVADVRLAAVTALNSLKRRRHDLALDHALLGQRCLTEIATYGRMRDGARAELPDSRPAKVLRDLFKRRAQASLECVFRLLALTHPEEALRNSLGALSSGDRRRRQLALELLDTLVPAAVRQALVEIEENLTPPRGKAALDLLDAVGHGQDEFLAALARIVRGERSPEGSITMSEALVEDILELQAVSLFSQASAEDLAELATLLVDRPAPKGTVIFREGDEPDNLYLVRKGQIALARRGEVVEQVGAGEAFGVVAVLDKSPRELTATCVTDCTLRVLSGEDLLQLATDRPPFMHSLFRALTAAVRGQLDKVALGKKSESA